MTTTKIDLQMNEQNSQVSTVNGGFLWSSLHIGSCKVGNTESLMHTLLILRNGPNQNLINKIFKSKRCTKSRQVFGPDFGIV